MAELFGVSLEVDYYTIEASYLIANLMVMAAYILVGEPLESSYYSTVFWPDM